MVRPELQRTHGTVEHGVGVEHDPAARRTRAPCRTGSRSHGTRRSGPLDGGSRYKRVAYLRQGVDTPHRRVLDLRHPRRPRRQRPGLHGREDLRAAAVPTGTKRTRAAVARWPRRRQSHEERPRRVDTAPTIRQPLSTELSSAWASRTEKHSPHVDVYYTVTQTPAAYKARDMFGRPTARTWARVLPSLVRRDRLLGFGFRSQARPGPARPTADRQRARVLVTSGVCAAVCQWPRWGLTAPDPEEHPAVDRMHFAADPVDELRRQARDQGDAARPAQRRGSRLAAPDQELATASFACLIAITPPRASAASRAPGTPAWHTLGSSRASVPAGSPPGVPAGDPVARPAGAPHCAHPACCGLGSGSRRARGFDIGIGQSWPRSGVIAADA